MNRFAGPFVYEICKGIGNALGFDTKYWIVYLIGIAVMVGIIALLYNKCRVIWGKNEGEPYITHAHTKCEKQQGKSQVYEQQNMSMEELMAAFNKAFGNIQG